MELGVAAGAGPLAQALLSDNGMTVPTHAELRRGPDGVVLAISGPLNVETVAATRLQIRADLRAAPVLPSGSVIAGGPAVLP
jgi:hypothetical protein